MARHLANEEVASRILRIYFREVARLGYKRRLSLDEVINAYYYTLSRLGGKEKSMEKLVEKVKEEESELKTETKEELLPSLAEAGQAERPIIGKTEPREKPQIVETETVEETTEESKAE